MHVKPHDDAGQDRCADVPDIAVGMRPHNRPHTVNANESVAVAHIGSYDPCSVYQDVAVFSSQGPVDVNSVNDVRRRLKQRVDKVGKGQVN